MRFYIYISMTWNKQLPIVGTMLVDFLRTLVLKFLCSQKWLFSMVAQQVRTLSDQEDNPLA